MRDNAPHVPPDWRLNMGKTILKDIRSVTVQPNWTSGKIQFSDALFAPYKGQVVEIEFVVREHDGNKLVQETEK